jgi:hypothetical protein
VLTQQLKCKHLLRSLLENLEVIVFFPIFAVRNTTKDHSYLIIMNIKLKKVYVKPTVVVYELPSRTLLLSASEGTEDYNRNNPQDW